MGLAKNFRIRRHVPFHSTRPLSLRNTMRLWQFEGCRFRVGDARPMPRNSWAIGAPNLRKVLGIDDSR